MKGITVMLTNLIDQLEEQSVISIFFYFLFFGGILGKCINRRAKWGWYHLNIRTQNECYHLNIRTRNKCYNLNI